MTNRPAVVVIQRDGQHPLTVVQRHLGHESIRTTSDRYGHLDRKSSRVVADVVGKALKPRKANSKPKNAAGA